MATVVELEGAPAAIEAGTTQSLDAATSAVVSVARRRKALILFNNEESETIFVRFADSGATATAGIPVKAGTGLVIKKYFGAVSAFATNGATLFKAEF